MRAASEIKNFQYANSVSGIVDNFLLTVPNAVVLREAAQKRNATLIGRPPGEIIHSLGFKCAPVETVTSLQAGESEQKDTFLGLDEDHARWALYSSASNRRERIESNICLDMQLSERTDGKEIIEDVARDVIRQHVGSDSADHYLQPPELAKIAEDAQRRFKDDLEKAVYEYGETDSTSRDIKLEVLNKSYDSDLAALILTNDGLLQEFTPGEIAAALYQGIEDRRIYNERNAMARYMVGKSDEFDTSNPATFQARLNEMTESQNKLMRSFAKDYLVTEYDAVEERRDLIRLQDDLTAPGQNPGGENTSL